VTRAAPELNAAESDGEDYRAFSIAIDKMRNREQAVALINPEARRPEVAASNDWLSARLSIGALPQVLLPHCDARCAEAPHDARSLVVLADLALDATQPRRSSWWESWNETLQGDLRAVRVWYAGSPLLPDTPPGRQLRAGTRLTRVTTTDPYWVHYDTMYQETLFRIESGRYEGDALIAATFGLSPLLPGLAGTLIAPDHPPVRDPEVAIRLLAAGWASVERGLPFEG
jgi:hypothetical protein